jgi:hypothetical protein
MKEMKNEGKIYVKIMVFWVVSLLYNMVDGYKHFRVT